MTSIAIDRNDGLSSSTAIKGPCRVVATSAITLSGLQTIDGVSLAAGDRVLYAVAGVNAGIWNVDTGSWRRAKDFAGNRDVRLGTQIYVTSGTTYSASGWYVNTANPIVVGSTAITISQNVMLNAAQLIALEASATAAAGSAASSASASSSSATAAAGSAAAAAAAIAGVTTFVVDTYTIAQTLTIPVTIKSVTLMGRTSYGDRAGLIPCVRVNAPVTTHTGWFRSVDRFKADGTTDATNGGYWEFAVGSHANVCAFGAVANGVTDDFPAIDGARDYLVAKWARGELFFPGSNGPYLCNGTIDLSTSRITMSAANQAVVVFTGPNDVNLVKINQSNVRVKDISLYGKGITGLATADTDVGTITQPVVWITSNTVHCKIDGCIIYGGTGVLWEGGDCKMYDNEVSRSYGNALVKIDGSAGRGSGWLRRNALDHAVFLTSQGIQKVAGAFPARVNSTPYIIGDVVAYSGMLLECTTAGNSGGSSPTLKNYNVAMPDGDVVWNVVCPGTFYALLCDTDAKEVYCHQQDMSGPFSYGLGFQNCPGIYFRIEDGVIGGVRNGGIIVRTGADLNFSGLTIGGGPIIGFPGLIVTDSFAGDVRFHHNKLFFVARGIYWAITGSPGATINASDNTIHCSLGTSGTVATAFDAAANTTFFKFSDNVVSGGSIGAQVIAGTSDHYHITNNLNAAGITPTFFIVDAGTGINKRIAGNV